MKIKKEDVKNDFKPFDVTITVESKGDLELLQQITSMNVSIPEVIYMEFKTSHNETAEFLHQLRRELL